MRIIFFRNQGGEMLYARCVGLSEDFTIITYIASLKNRNMVLMDYGSKMEKNKDKKYLFFIIFHSS